MNLHESPNELVWAIVVGAGSGRRFGSEKQFVELEGRRVLQRAVEGAARMCGGVVVVLPERRLDFLAKHGIVGELGHSKVEELRDGMASELRDGMASELRHGKVGEPGHGIVGELEHGMEGESGHGMVGEFGTKRIEVATGGNSRSGSVRNGLAKVPLEAEIVLIHDAARPLASSALYQRVIDAVVDGADGAAPALPVTDTLRHRDGEPVNRDDFLALQTPQGFKAEVLQEVHQGCPEATDDVSLVFDSGGSVKFVEGEHRNLKLTTPYDLKMASFYLANPQ